MDIAAIQTNPHLYYSVFCPGPGCERAYLIDFAWILTRSKEKEAADNSLRWLFKHQRGIRYLGIAKQ
jgi:hypothetical protein